MAARSDPVRDYFAVDASPVQSYHGAATAARPRRSVRTAAQVPAPLPPGRAALNHPHMNGTRANSATSAAATIANFAVKSNPQQTRSSTKSESHAARAAPPAKRGRKPKAMATALPPATVPPPTVSTATTKQEVKAIATVNAPTPAQQMVQDALSAGSTTRLTRTLLSRAKGAMTKISRPSFLVPAAIVAASAGAYVEPTPTPTSTMYAMSDQMANGQTDEDQDKGSSRLCTVPDCVRRIRSKGLCKAHGGGRRCTIEGCERSSQSRGLCIRHGGGTRCTHEDCDKAAQSNGLCKAHGGGLRCQFQGCTKATQGGGYCRNHGGGQRCGQDGCDKGAQRGGFCASHGGTRYCQYRDCTKQDRGGGLCAEHGGGKRCKLPACSKPARRQGYCHTHASAIERSQQAQKPAIAASIAPAPQQQHQYQLQQHQLHQAVSMDQFADL